MPRMRTYGLLLPALIVVGCQGPPDYVLQAPGELMSSDDLYSDKQVWDIQIHLGDDSCEALRHLPREYTVGDVTINGETITDVGVRLKGSFSFESLDGKAAFKIKFNWRRQDQRFLGLEGLTLNNLIQDRAFVHEWLGYRLFREAGVPAPRSGYARVFVNDELYGLYANVESVDDAFLTRNFADPKGNLYEEVRFSDLHPEDVWEFEQDEGADTSRQDLMDFIAAANQPGDSVFTSGLLDTDSFLAFVTTEVAIGHWDGYNKAHNYRIYHEPTLDQWSFIPWGIDQAFDIAIKPFGGRGFLTQKCLAFDACLASFTDIGLDVVALMEQLDLDVELDRIAEWIEPFADEDARKPYVLAKYKRHQAQVRAYLQEQPARLRARLDCVVDGAEADDDGDGHGACFADCDDRDDAISPGALEVCDGRDNNCDGIVDELASCACAEHDVAGATFLLCEQAMSWTMARSHCTAQGASLAWIDSQEQNDALFSLTQSLVRDHWYIGLNDREEEMAYAWQSGDDVAYANWAEGDPDDFGEEDCVVLDRFADGGWTDLPCRTEQPFVCRR